MNQLEGRNKLLSAIYDSTPTTTTGTTAQNHGDTQTPIDDEFENYEPEFQEIVNDCEVPEESPSEKPVQNQEQSGHVANRNRDDENVPEKLKKILVHVEEFNAQELWHKEFTPLKWAVDGFLPSGLSILAGGPKVGKSIMSLQLSLAVAIGGCALGKINVEKGDALYLALEDTPRRLQERIQGSGIPEGTDLSRLTLTTRVPRQHEGGLEYIRWWLERHKEARLVIIDTLQKFRKQLSGKGNIYAEDYDAVSEVKKLADEFDVPILVIHHLKKAMSDDWLNEISGSQGIAGAADTIFSLKRTRTESDGVLHRTGRDVEEKDFDMTLDGFMWILVGDKGLFTLSEPERRLVYYLREHGSITPAELSKIENIPVNTAQTNIRRLCKKKLLVKTGFGKYALSQEYSDD